MQYLFEELCAKTTTSLLEKDLSLIEVLKEIYKLEYLERIQQFSVGKDSNNGTFRYEIELKDTSTLTCRGV